MYKTTWGYKYTMSGTKKSNNNFTDPFNKEGVIKRHRKWVVRVPNTNPSTKKISPFKSLAQYDIKQDAVDRYDEYKKVA